MNRNPFATYHPAVAFVFLACAIVISMAALQPVFVALSFLGALACSVVCRGARATAGSFVWIVPLWLVESLVYGACSGGMLASVFLWFSSYAACMNSANTMALFGNVLPIVSLMVSQVMRLVPQFVARGRGIAAAQDAVSAAAPQTKRQQTAGRLRIVSVLMGWGMEDGIERSDAMRARGYDCGARRTTYKRYRFGRADASVLAAIVVLAAIAGACAAAVCLRFSFYPTLSGWGAWWAYLPYALLMAVPSALRFKEWLLWRS